MKATVIYPQDKTMFVDIPDGLTVQGALNTLWNMMNPDSGDPTVTRMNAEYHKMDTKRGWGVRSSMVGDIYVLPVERQEYRYFYVNCTGFVEITDMQSIFIQSLESHEQVMGWDYLRKQYSKLGEPILSFS